MQQQWFVSLNALRLCLVRPKHMLEPHQQCLVCSSSEGLHVCEQINVTKVLCWKCCVPRLQHGDELFLQHAECKWQTAVLTLKSSAVQPCRALFLLRKSSMVYTATDIQRKLHKLLENGREMLHVDTAEQCICCRHSNLASVGQQCKIVLAHSSLQNSSHREQLS